MRRSKLLPILACLPLAACSGSDEPDITWRLPCGATGTYSSAPEYQYRFEFDERGNETLEEITDLATGTQYSLSTVTYDDDNIALTADYTSETTKYSVANETSGHRLVKSTLTDLDGDTFDFGYTNVWVWDSHGDLQSIDTVYTSPDFTDNHETYEKTATGYASTLCMDTSAPCDRWTYEGGRYVGDFDRATLFAADLATDGTPDYREERTFDSHALLLTDDVFQPDDAGALVADQHAELDREPDGTALAFRTLRFGDQPTTYTVQYQFECPSARMAPGGGERPQLPPPSNRTRLSRFLRLPLTR